MDEATATSQTLISKKSTITIGLLLAIVTVMIATVTIAWSWSMADREWKVTTDHRLASLEERIPTVEWQFSMEHRVQTLEAKKISQAFPRTSQ